MEQICFIRKKKVHGSKLLYAEGTALIVKLSKNDCLQKEEHTKKLPFA